MDEIEEGCGYEYDHTLKVLSSDADGTTWICTECDAEIFEENE